MMNALHSLPLARREQHFSAWPVSKSRCEMMNTVQMWPRSFERPIVGVLETYFPLDDEDEEDDENW